MDLANYQQKEHNIEYEIHQGEKDFHNCRIAKTGINRLWKYLLIKPYSILVIFIL